MPDSVLGIDTSNYTTSAALLCNGEIVNRKKLLPVRQGERGLRQSEAVFHHVRQLPEVLTPLLERADKIAAIGVSDAPRRAENSYMPCFSAGVSCAEILSAAVGVPTERFSHQQGHIAAALYSAGKLELLEHRFLAFHVSGGTTEALLVSPDQNGMPEAEIVAASLDLKAGQAVDRVGVLLGMRFPCGPEMEQEALKWEGKIHYRPAMKGNFCSLSGIENKCILLQQQGHPKEEIARFCLEATAVTLDAMCRGLLEEYKGLPVLFSGGVCSNSILRQRLQAGYSAYFAQPEFSSDNAAGVALLAERKRCLS